MSSPRVVAARGATAASSRGRPALLGSWATMLRTPSLHGSSIAGGVVGSRGRTTRYTGGTTGWHDRAARQVLHCGVDDRIVTPRGRKSIGLCCLGGRRIFGWG